MRDMRFIYDGHDYYIRNADDDQDRPSHGDTIVDSAGQEVVYFTHDGEYFVAEHCTSPAYHVVHENCEDAEWTAVKAVLASL